MRCIFRVTICIMIFFVLHVYAADLASPSPQQLEWQDMELEMFLCLDPCTWQDTERDNFSTPLERINPTELDTDQWVHTAKSMGAGQIIFVAKHVGGFCWWRTETTDYGIKDTPWKNGKGDVLKDLSDSCRKMGVKLGIYVYPGDRSFGAAVGGKCKTPEQQELYNKVYRTQLTEVLSRYGKMHEVWFDGSIVIPVGDILAKYAPDAIVFQGPHANIRWVGNEKGIAPYPAWNSVTKEDALTGVATARHGDPNGTVWMPLECDARIRSTWFWKTNNAHTLKSVDELMDMYYKSVGHGAVLLLNNTPDTTGLIPELDVKRSAEFGAEIKRRFKKSIAETDGVGDEIELILANPTTIDHIITMENITFGERVRKYVIEGYVNDNWIELCHGSAIGHKKIDRIEPVHVSKVRFRCLESIEKPLVRKLAVYNIQ